MQITIPCETIVRLSHACGDDRIVRFENGIALATDRHIMAIEKLPRSFDGIAHIQLTDDLLNRCRVEALAGTVLNITVMDALKWTISQFSGDNIGVWSVDPDLDHWRERVIEPLKQVPAHPYGGMVWHVDQIARLARCSPSGRVVFEETIDVNSRPTIMRDVSTYDWCGIFLPRLHDGKNHGSATLPGWLK